MSSERFQHRDLESTKLACVSLFRRLNMLNSFFILNYTAIFKILSQYEELQIHSQGGHGTSSLASSVSGSGSVSASPNVVNPVSPNYFVVQEKLKLIEKKEMFDSQKLTDLISALEKQYSDHFCQSNILAARADLLVTQSTTTKRSNYWFGFRSGAVVVMFSWVLWDLFIDMNVRQSTVSPAQEPSYTVYACMLSWIVLFWMWGFNLWAWRTHRVNYHLLLELSPNSKSHTQVFTEATGLTFVFLANFMIFYKSQRSEQGDFPNWISKKQSRIFPFLLLLYFAFKAFYPWRKKKFLWGTIKEIIISPFGRVTFREFFVADFLTSLVKPMIFLVYSWCFYLSGEWLTDPVQEGAKPAAFCDSNQLFMQIITPLLSALPLWFRFLQCVRRYRDTGKRFPNLANAAKYALAHSVVFLGLVAQSANGDFRGVWIASLVLSTLYTFYWDVKMDWGLGSRTLTPNCFDLRDRLMFPHKNFYYFAIGADLIMRFLWTLTLVQWWNHWPLEAVVSSLLLGVIEISRRSMWACFRLEAEHLQNTEGYRPIEIIPLHFATATAQPEDDEEDEKGSQTWRATAEVIIFSLLVMVFALVTIFLTFLKL
eukprot:c20445_g1_i6.p1 GENE.c20445_g1_i6~~c20445_g1_i6.p1  ORF type:complete len:596 (+),score=187.30 c20445_g1_i6:352-2139(+)